MNYFDYFPVVKAERRIVKTYSQAAAVLLDEINIELKRYGLGIKEKPLWISPGCINFQAIATNSFHNEDIRSLYAVCKNSIFTTLKELDNEVGNLIREYGKSAKASKYIDDAFLPFSELLKRRNPLFKKLLDEEEANLRTVYMLDKKEKYKLISFYGLLAKEKDVLPAFKAYKESEFDGQRDLIWSCAICQMLSVRIQGYGSTASVQGLLINFKDQVL